MPRRDADDVSRGAPPSAAAFVPVAHPITSALVSPDALVHDYADGWRFWRLRAAVLQRLFPEVLCGAALPRSLSRGATAPLHSSHHAPPTRAPAPRPPPPPTTTRARVCVHRYARSGSCSTPRRACLARLVAGRRASTASGPTSSSTSAPPTWWDTSCPHMVPTHGAHTWCPHGVRSRLRSRLRRTGRERLVSLSPNGGRTPSPPKEAALPEEGGGRRAEEGRGGDWRRGGEEGRSSAPPPHLVGVALARARGGGGGAGWGGVEE